jgi:hypothetical protein
MCHRKLFLVLVSLCALLAIPATTGAAEKKVYKWGFASQNATNHAMGLAHIYLAGGRYGHERCRVLRTWESEFIKEMA